MKLSKEDMRSFIIGMLLGDGSTSLGKNAKNYNLNCCHNPKQYEYLIWKYDILKENLCKNYWTHKYKSHFSGKALHKGNANKEYDMYRASLGTHTLVTYIRKVMYVDNKKFVSMDLLNMLTPIGLAIWYMDDGNLAYKKNKDGSICSREISLNIQGFDNESQENIVEYFKNVFGIESRLHKTRDKRRLWMNTTNSKKFLEIVKEYVSLVECMHYKIDLKYGYKPTTYNIV